MPIIDLWEPLKIAIFRPVFFVKGGFMEKEIFDKEGFWVGKEVFPEGRIFYQDRGSLPLECYFFQKDESTHEKGMTGEMKASFYLKEKGYQILERNFRNRQGEIDIIALEKKIGKNGKENNVLVFFEVKSLPHGDLDTLGAELNKRKQKKIVKTAKCYLEKHREYSKGYIRFDVLAMDVPGLEPVHHITNAFVE